MKSIQSKGLSIRTITRRGPSMDLAISQQNRLLEVASSWDKDEVILTHFSGIEAISELFHYQLTLLPNYGALTQAVIGKPITVTLQNKEGMRYFNGVIATLVLVSNQQTPRAYQIEMMPHFAGLQFRRNYRIFQNSSVVDIFKTICHEHNLRDYNVSGLHCQYLSVEYCVQFDETDFAFLNRILAGAGIFYCFTHQQDKHVIHLLDHPRYAPYHRQKILYTPAQSQQDEYISTFNLSAELTGLQVQSSDYNYRKPQDQLVQQSKIASETIKREQFIYPAKAKTDEELKQKVNLQQQAMSNSKEVAAGESNVKNLTAGMQFDLVDADNGALTGEYVVTKIYHYAEDLTHQVDQHEQQVLAQSYHNEFSTIPAKQIYTPKRLQRQVSMSGMDTAVVTGVRYQDVLGHHCVEVKCQFHWDRFGQQNENSSKWIRVAGAAAGKNFGTQFLPRKGEEVLVVYRNGDPDEPLVIGSAYHGEHRLPFNDQDMQYSSGIKTHTVGSQDKNDGHHILFKDKSNRETFNIKAVRKLNIVAGQNEKVVVGAHQAISVGGNQFTQVGQEVVLATNDRFEIHAGGSSIIMTPDKIETKGAKIRVSKSAAGAAGNADIHNAILQELETEVGKKHGKA